MEKILVVYPYIAGFLLLFSFKCSILQWDCISVQVNVIWDYMHPAILFQAHG